MKNKAFFSAYGLLIFILCSFLGCTAEPGGGDDVYDDIRVVPVIPKDLQKPEYDDPTAVFDGANDFAFRLSAALAEQEGPKNLICSPLSVWIPLAALANGTSDQYKAGLLNALGIPGLGEADINNGVSRMLYDLTRQREKEDYGEEPYHDPVKIANAIFVDYEVTIKKDFAQTFMDYFRGSSINVDFKSPAAVKEVNSWAKEHTNGMIPKIIQEFPLDTAAVIANAIYFFDRWDWEFEPAGTVEDVFYAPGGEETRAFYMRREGDDLIYYEDDKLQAMPLDFKSGGGMYILLPKDGNAEGLLTSLSNEYFNKIQTGSMIAKGKLLLPRFSIDGDIMSFKDILIALGVPLFNEDSLTGVIQEAPVQLSDAIHKAMIKVDEKGTTAAAVTLLVMDVASAGPQKPEKIFEMNCNKPFVFVLYDRSSWKSGQVLFTGMVNKP